MAIVFVLFTHTVFSQKDDVKSGTIRVVKKKYNVKRIYPREINYRFFSERDIGPSLVVANLYGRYGSYVMSAQELLIQKKLFVNSDEYEVVSFDLTFSVNGIQVVERSDGNRFSENQALLANYARRGTRLYLENIKCKNPDGVIKNIGSIVIKTPSGLVFGQTESAGDPFLIASISGIYGKGVLNIKKRDLHNAKKIDLADSTSKIVSFSMSCNCTGKSRIEHSASDQFTPKMMNILSKTSSGDTIFIRNIRYSSEGGPIRSYGNMKYAVVR